MSSYYLTTPIYYVNDRPHIGHCYTTLVADVAARYHRLLGREVFFLTGTDEHADKVVTSGAAHGLAPLEWSDRNAAEFQKAFAFMNFSHDDFIRTTQDRHKSKVLEYVRALQATGDVYLGDYVGWYDESQDEYLTETVAKDSPHGPYTSPVTGRPLTKKTEKNYFFRLSAYEHALKAHIDANPDFIQPDARRNEVLGRLREGLQDVPISRAIGTDPASQWGIRMPDDPTHRIYVWIDALFNYLSAIDTPQREHLWPPAVHVMAKDILWFHAVIWPAMLMALKRPLPRQIYAHAYWVRDGKKMSKSLGNFVDIDTLRAYVDRFSLDAVRYYLITQGPIAQTDSDFSHAHFVEIFNADLANGLGNAASRVGNMIVKYFAGRCPDAKGHTGFAGYDWPTILSTRVRAAIVKADTFDLPGALAEGLALVRQVDQYINATEPFKLAKKIPSTDPSGPGGTGVPSANETSGTGVPPVNEAGGTGVPPVQVSPERDQLAAILYHCAEAIRVAAMLLAPAMPTATAALLANWSVEPLKPGEGHALAHCTTWGGHHSLQPGQPIAKGDILFMRADPADPPPQPAQPPSA